MAADRVVFTSGGTEAANLAVFGLLRAADCPSKHFLTTAIEHPCILETADQLQNCEVGHLQPNTDGTIDLGQFRAQLRSETQLVSVMLANNETGVLQPVAEIAKICAEQGIAMHTDAAQAVGKLPVDFANLNVTALSCAAHKFCGPLGIGALLLRHDVPLQPTLFGGHQQAGLRPGTEMVALAVGMATALECWHSSAHETFGRLSKLRDQFEQTITAAIPSVEIIGSGAPRLPNTSNLAFVGFNRQALLMALDQVGIACSSGSACASGSSEPSPVLMAMRLEKTVVAGSVRFSLGSSTTATEIEEACRRILSVCQRLR